MIHFKETEFGFEYGSAKVQRTCSDEKKGWVQIAINTPKHQGQGLSVYVTKTGKVRIYDRRGEWAAPECAEKHG